MGRPPRRRMAAGLTAATSWVTNVNTYQAAYPYGTPWPPTPAPPWNFYVNGIDFQDWKSPFVTTSPNDAPRLTGTRRSREPD